MKHLILLISALLFSTFFYNQNIGLNLSLFTMLTIIILVIKNRKIFKDKNTTFKIAAYLMTGVTVFLYTSNLTIIANIVAFFTLIGSISEHKSSVYINWINGIYTTVAASFSLYYNTLNIEVNNVKKVKISYTYWLKIIGIPAIILLIFISLYRKGNPMFNDFILKIDFSFINLNWLFFTLMGYYLFYNITHPIQIEPATAIDLKTGNYLEKDSFDDISVKKLETEKQLGVVLMVVLNLLIIFFLITDVLHLSEIHQMRAAQLSKQVHSGVNALIVSNVLAILIILYFFRGPLNFFEKNNDLKRFTFLWIFLNLSVVFDTAIKNIEYVSSFGFTYKRIGVLFFLTAISVGLITTYLKVSQIKNFWYLVRKNTQIAFVLLMLSSSLNWDKIITYYNINNADQIDLNYLINLSDNNTFLLKEYVEKNEINTSNQFSINKKHTNYLKDLQNNTWQEMVYDNFKVKK